jgi:hypothetical protein
MARAQKAAADLVQQLSGMSTKEQITALVGVLADIKVENEDLQAKHDRDVQAYNYNIQQLQDQVATAPQRAGPRGRLPTLTFEGKEGEDWVLFKAGFLNAAKFEGYTVINSKRALKSCMRGPALLATEIVDHEDTNLTLDEVIARYEEIFLPPAASTMAITRFETAVQLPKETVMAFHSRLASLFARAHPDYNANVPQPIKDGMLIRRFYQGLKKQKLREEIQRRAPATYNAALTAAQAELAIMDGSNLLHLGMGGAEPMEIGALGMNAMDRNQIECHNCFKKGHIWRECPLPLPKPGGGATKQFTGPKKGGSWNTNKSKETGKPRREEKGVPAKVGGGQYRSPTKLMAAMTEEWEARQNGEEGEEEVEAFSEEHETHSSPEQPEAEDEEATDQDFY